ncbi:hypothetical protein [Actinoallomurus sp. NPDC050550]|uniref:hypothetical protein n=1 Tax=Actinoallomurus sp. NPDC050550 TaxID=3154937 RepID=UPI0033EB869E
MKLPMLVATGNGELAAKAHTGFGLIGSFAGWVQALPWWVLLPVGLVSFGAFIMMGVLAMVLGQTGDEHAGLVGLGAVTSLGVALFLLLSLPF